MILKVDIKKGKVNGSVMLEKASWRSSAELSERASLPKGYSPVVECSHV